MRLLEEAREDNPAAESIYQMQRNGQRLQAWTIRRLPGHSDSLGPALGGPSEIPNARALTHLSILRDARLRVERIVDPA